MDTLKELLAVDKEGWEGSRIILLYVDMSHCISDSKRVIFSRIVWIKSFWPFWPPKHEHYSKLLLFKLESTRCAGTF